MISVLIAVSVAVLTFGSGMLGLFLQRKLPTEHMSGGSRDMILAIIGLVTLLLALVLGTIVGNSYAFFAAQKSGLETFASRALMVDEALAQYGPEARPVRDRMKEVLTQSYEVFWRGADSDPGELRVDSALARWRAVAASLRALDAATPAQKEALAAASVNLGLLEQTRLLMSLQLVSPLASSLLIVVVAWSTFLFLGFGVLSGLNTTTVVALAMGAISVASAVYLIHDLSEPYSGTFRVSPAALEQTIEAIDK